MNRHLATAGVTALFAMLALAMTQGLTAALDQQGLAVFAAVRGPVSDEFFALVTWLGAGDVPAPAVLIGMAIPRCRRAGLSPAEEIRRHAVRPALRRAARLQRALQAGAVAPGAGAGLALALALWLHGRQDAAVILLATGMVLAAELFNTAIAAVCDFMETRRNEKIGIIKNIAAAGMAMPGPVGRVGSGSRRVVAAPHGPQGGLNFTALLHPAKPRP